MARVNMIIGRKGGIGKSLIAAVLGEYLRDKRVAAKKTPPVMIDLDPNNASFSAIKGLGAKFLDIMAGDDIDPRKFDALIGQIFKSKTDDAFVIDTGSNAYIPLMGYMVYNSVPQMLLDSGHEMYLHVPIMGGAEVLQTMECLTEIGMKMPEGAKIVVWQNTKNGSIEYKGISLENSKPYTALKDAGRIICSVEIPEWRSDMATDIAESLKLGKTFEEAATDEHAHIMVKQRMIMAKRYIYQAIDAAKVCA